MAAPVVTLTTDFGRRDPYVASMKGVIRSRCPDLAIDDLSHEIPPQDLREAALFVETAVPHYPPGSIHVVVVDPGVGGSRRAIAVRAHQQILLGPDNGVLSLAWGDAPEVREIANAAWFRHPVSPTFHGRDVFAPVAARLASGEPFDAVGPLLTDPVHWALPVPTTDAQGVARGEVIHVDRFGNCITNLRLPGGVAAGFTLEVGAVRVPILRTYADASPHTALGLVGSTGRVELAVRDGNAAAVHGLGVGSAATLHITINMNR